MNYSSHCCKGQSSWSIDIGECSRYLTRLGFVSNLHAVVMKKEPKLFLVATAVKGGLVLSCVTYCEHVVKSEGNRVQMLCGRIGPESPRHHYEARVREKVAQRN